MWIRQVCVVGADVAPDPEEELVPCPVCKGVPTSEQRLCDVMTECPDDVTFVVVICEVCERTGKVSRRLARELWEHMAASA